MKFDAEAAKILQELDSWKERINAQINRKRELTIRARVIAIEGRVPEIEEWIEHGQYLIVPDGVRFFVWKGRLVIMERQDNWRRIWTAIDLPNEPEYRTQSAANPSVATVAQWSYLEGHEGQ